MYIEKYSTYYQEKFISLYQKTYAQSPIYKEVWEEEEIIKLLQENEIYLLLNKEKIIMGFIGGSIYANLNTLSDIESSVINKQNKVCSFYIAELVIADDYRGKGFAFMLLKCFVNNKIKSGITNFIIHTKYDNPVCRLYERVGFTPIKDQNGKVLTRNICSNTNKGTQTYKGIYMTLNIPTLENLKTIFNFIKNQNSDGINGVLEYDSGVSGKILGITMCTHGNEPVGLAILDFFIKTQLWTKIKNGKIIFILQNIAATREYFDNLFLPERSKCRFYHHNYNRLPENVIDIEATNIYEFNRVKELYPFYQKFDVGFDIHTSNDPKPMIIAGSRFHPNLVKGFPIETVITNIAKEQIGIPSFELFGGIDNDIPVFEIEAGTHESPTSFKVAIDCCIALLINMKMLEGRTVKAVDSYKEYAITDSVIFKDESYEMSKVFNYYEQLHANQILALSTNSKNSAVVCKEDGHAIFPPTKQLKKPFSLNEEQMFISKPVNIIN